MGVGTALVRGPRLELTGEEKEHVQKVLEQALVNRPAL